MNSQSEQDLFGRSKKFAGRVVVEWTIDHLKLALTTICAFALYSFGITEDWWPSPVEIIRGDRGGPGEENRIRRPLDVSAITYQNDGGAAGQLGESMHLSILPRLDSVSDTLSGLELRYGLTGLSSTSGTKNSVTLAWAMRLPQSEWLTCRQGGLRFDTRRGLEIEVARTLNNALASSEAAGDLQCT
ncbi:hypothetical protein [Aurantiacibacter rhizosphaerae]|uniref:Uncharacterized protein n=1 Tax=Aurantiacibacter rhizosphaerae TaxID=2691582 RepID=A0A844XBE8_9SPHN|nr:hypothetical protein [Aurantiacibacter rhizosphaerae]MWV27737.1 hypothetical protein [Aurantiacibacter rhizosphaerae]